MEFEKSKGELTFKPEILSRKEKENSSRATPQISKSTTAKSGSMAQTISHSSKSSMRQVSETNNSGIICKSSDLFSGPYNKDKCFLNRSVLTEAPSFSKSQTNIRHKRVNTTSNGAQHPVSLNSRYARKTDHPNHNYLTQEGSNMSPSGLHLMSSSETSSFINSTPQRIYIYIYIIEYYFAGGNSTTNKTRVVNYPSPKEFKPTTTTEIIKVKSEESKEKERFSGYSDAVTKAGKPVLIVDVNLGKSSMAQLVVRRGDEVENVVVHFASKYGILYLNIIL